MSPVQVKVDTKTSTVGRIVTLVASVAGVSDAVVVVEGAPAGACAIAAAPDAGDLEGVATCARYLASLATAEGEAAPKAKEVLDAYDAFMNVISVEFNRPGRPSTKRRLRSTRGAPSATS